MSTKLHCVEEGNKLLVRIAAFTDDAGKRGPVKSKLTEQLDRGSSCPGASAAAPSAANKHYGECLTMVTF